MKETKTGIRRSDRIKTKNILVIQKNVKRLLYRKDFLKNKIKNTTTFLGDPIYEIPQEYQYVYDGFMFDLRELKKYGKNINPYTNVPFPFKVYYEIKKKSVADLEEEEHHCLSSAFANFCSELTHYPDINQMQKYNAEDIYYYYRCVYESPLVKNIISIDDDRKIYELYYQSLDNDLKIKIYKTLTKVMRHDDEHHLTREYIMCENIVEDPRYHYCYNHEVDNYFL